MKKLIIALLAVSLFAVQGYAQGARGHGGNHNGSHRGARTEHFRPSNGSSHHNRGSSAGGTTRHGGNHHGGSSLRQGGHNHGGQSLGHGHGSSYHHGSHYAPPPRNHHHNHNHWGYGGSWRSSYHHHHNYHHHHHHCIFDSWAWYTWGGYTNRFIRHNHYHNRYFDSMLGYYLWDSFDAPTRIDIGSMSFTRYQSKLKITIGNNVSYLSLYQYQKVTYQVENTYVEVTVNSGYATLYFYDEYGNSATYRL